MTTRIYSVTTAVKCIVLRHEHINCRHLLFPWLHNSICSQGASESTSAENRCHLLVVIFGQNGNILDVGQRMMIVIRALYRSSSMYYQRADPIKRVQKNLEELYEENIGQVFLSGYQLTSSHVGLQHDACQCESILPAIDFLPVQLWCLILFHCYFISSAVLRVRALFKVVSSKSPDKRALD